MATRIGILTAGGDCPGLNATIRGVAKAMYQKMNDVEIVGIVDGFKGLIEGETIRFFRNSNARRDDSRHGAHAL